MGYVSEEEIREFIEGRERLIEFCNARGANLHQWDFIEALDWIFKHFGALELRCATMKDLIDGVQKKLDEVLNL